MDKTADAVGYYSYQKQSIWQKAMSRIFPIRRVDIPENLEGFAESYINTFLTAKLDWKDRIRVLFSGVVKAQIQIKTQFDAGKCYSESAVYIGKFGSEKERG